MTSVWISAVVSALIVAAVGEWKVRKVRRQAAAIIAGAPMVPHDVEKQIAFDIAGALVRVLQLDEQITHDGRVWTDLWQRLIECDVPRLAVAVRELDPALLNDFMHSHHRELLRLRELAASLVRGDDGLLRNG